MRLRPVRLPNPWRCFLRFVNFAIDADGAASGAKFDAIIATYRLKGVERLKSFMGEQLVPILHLGAPNISGFENAQPLGAGAGF